MSISSNKILITNFYQCTTCIFISFNIIFEGFLTSFLCGTSCRNVIFTIKFKIFTACFKILFFKKKIYIYTHFISNSIKWYPVSGIATPLSRKIPIHWISKQNRCLKLQMNFKILNKSNRY